MFARLPRGRLAARQHGRDRREEVAPVKACGEVLRPPIDIEAARRRGAPLNELEQAITRSYVPAAVRLEHEGRARPADSWIDDTEKCRAGRKPMRISRQQVRRCLGIAEEVDNRDPRCHLMQHRLHLAGIGTLQPEIGEQHDHALAPGRLRRSPARTRLAAA